MRILDRYIGQTVAYSTLTVMLVILSLFTFFTFAGELNKTGRGNYDTLQAVQYALITMPSMLYQLFPTAVLIGTMGGLGSLASSSELVAMRAAGYSLFSILRSVLVFGLIMMGAVFLIGEYVAPVAQEYADTKRSLAMSGKDSLRTGTGLWIRDGLKFVRIESVVSGGQWENVSIYELDEKQRLKQVLRANRAIYGGDNKWILLGLEQQNISEGAIVIQHKDSDVWTSLLSPELLDVVVVRPDMMSAAAALDYVTYLEENGVEARKYLQAFWAKVSAPFSTAIMILLAIPFIFGPTRSMSAGHRILLGTLTGIGFYLFGQVFGYVGLVYELNPFLAATIPSFIFLGIALYLMRSIK
ncbi:MAG: LPS export ABC transporter permease LptG [Gammaproteobacteria bacterium]|nr:LPS export ABC transporter permease LptG [Gammaproteobacteria bacterium]